MSTVAQNITVSAYSAIAGSGAWTLDIQQNGAIRVIIAASAPAANDADWIAHLPEDNGRPYSVGPGESLFARSTTADMAVIVSEAPLGAGGGGGGGSSNTSEATQLLVLGELQSIDNKTPALSGGSVPVVGPLTNAQLRAARVPVETGNIDNKFREAAEAYDPVGGGRWTQTLASGDIIVPDGNAAAASYLVISKDPLSVGESRIESIPTWEMPFEMAIGLSLSQRTLGQEFAVEFVSTEAPLSTPADLTIASISQATTTLSVATSAAHNLRPGMRIGIRDCADSRMNYPALVVASTPTPLTFTATAGPGGNIPSLTAGPFTSGAVFFRSAMGLAPNGTSMIFENATATNASFYVRSEAGDVLPSGTIIGNHSATILSTASVQAINAALTYAFQPTNEFRLSQFIDGIQWSDVPIDSLAAANNRYKRTQVVPDIAATYRARIRATNNPSLSRPVAQIVSATKTGTTTATIVTATPHGLTTADQIVIYGIRDQAAASFPNLVAATAVASVVDATTFTVVIGTASTVTSYGGYVARINGGNLMSALGAIAQVVQSVARTANILTIVGSAAWAGLLIGDYINLVGVRDNVSGATLGVDGPYRVRDIQTTSLFLEPIGTAPTGTDITTTNCGGAVIKRTDMRISFIRAMDFERQRVEMLPRPSGDISAAASVNVQNVPAVTVNSGTITTVTGVTTVSTLSALTGGGAAEDAAAGANPVTVGGVVRTAAAPATLVAGDAARDTMTAAAAKTIAIGAPVASAEVASAARTTSGNSGVISVPTGGSIAGLIAVSAASGTTPTLDVTLEESYDNGTTWQTVWAAPRLTGTGNVPIPPMLVAGVRRWAWAIAGTTPSFTFAINTNQGSIAAPIVRKLFDRTANVLNGTLNAFTAALNVAGCRNITGKVALGAATTPATYQLQVSDDNVNWTNVGTATVAVASNQIAFSAPAGTVADWARIIVTSAGTSQTGTFASIHAN